MLNLFNMLAAATSNVYKSDAHATAHKVILGVLIGLMALSALVSIVCVLMQPSNSSGIDALGGSSETFFGKNKGKSIEEKMKKWTWISPIALAIFAVMFYVVLELPVFFS